MEELGESSEMSNSHVVCGSILKTKGQRRRGFGMMPHGRSKKEYKVSGSRNLLSVRSWSKPEEMKIWDAAQESCGKAFSL